MALGFVLQTTLTTALVGLKPSQLPRASSLLNATRNVFQSFGIAMLGAIFTNRFATYQAQTTCDLHNPGTSTGQQFLHLMQALQQQGLPALAAQKAAMGQLLGQLIPLDFNQALNDAYIVTFWLVVQMSFTFAHKYKSLKELKKDSFLIVQGSVQTQKIVLGSHGVPYIISTLGINRILKGSGIPAQTVLVRLPGGKAPDGITWKSDEFPLLQTGTSYILFLTPSPYPTVFYPVGAVQGVFTVTSQQVNSLGDIRSSS